MCGAVRCCVVQAPFPRPYRSEEGWRVGRTRDRSFEGLVVACLALAALTSCGAAEEASPTQTVEAFINAYNEGDSDAAVALLREDVVFEGGSFSYPDEIAGILDWWHAWGRVTTLGECSTSDRNVTCPATFVTDMTQHYGLGDIGVIYEFEVAEGEIVSLTENDNSEGVDLYQVTWIPFEMWVRENHPSDATVMFDQSGPDHSMNLTPESVSLFEKHVHAFIGADED